MRHSTASLLILLSTLLLSAHAAVRTNVASYSLTFNVGDDGKNNWGAYTIDLAVDGMMLISQQEFGNGDHWNGGDTRTYTGVVNQEIDCLHDSELTLSYTPHKPGACVLDPLGLFCSDNCKITFVVKFLDNQGGVIYEWTSSEQYVGDNRDKNLNLLFGDDHRCCLDASICNLCQSEFWYCDQCTSAYNTCEGVCYDQCPPGQYFDFAECACFLCDASCKECTGDEFTCTECNPGYYLEPADSTCPQCDPVCKTCNNGTRFDCLDPYLCASVRATDLYCCPNHCLSCNDSAICDICEETYLWHIGKCFTNCSDGLVSSKDKCLSDNFNYRGYDPMPSMTGKTQYKYSGLKTQFQQSDSTWSSDSWKCQDATPSTGTIGGRGSFLGVLAMLLDSFGYQLSEPVTPGSVASLLSTKLVDENCNFYYDFDVNAIGSPFTYDKTIQLLDGGLFNIPNYAISGLAEFYKDEQAQRAIRTLTGSTRYVAIAVWSRTVISGMVQFDQFEFAHNTLLLQWDHDETQSVASQFTGAKWKIADPLKTAPETLAWCADEVVGGATVRKCIKELRLYKY